MKLKEPKFLSKEEPNAINRLTKTIKTVNKNENKKVHYIKNQNIKKADNIETIVSLDPV